MIRRIFIAVLAMLAIDNAAAGPPDSVRQEILTRAHGAKSGVIVAVTESGAIAAETAWLLSAQVIRDESYAPYLLVIKPEERGQILKSLRLAESALPALIFYDHRGGEISRVVGALPSGSIKQARKADNAVN